MPKITVMILLFLVSLAPLVAIAGDDVDYSAPYLVVEDGELVTKYPAQEHDGGSADTGATDGDTSDSQAVAVDTEKNWRIAGVVLIVVVAAFIMTRRGQQRTKKAD